MRVGGRDVAVTNLDKVLFPRIGFTKRDLIEYVYAMAPYLLPHVADRPLTLARFPDGIDGRGWYQVRCPGRPAWVGTTPVPDNRGGVIDYCVVNDEAGLVWTANMGAIELHPFLWRTSCRKPDFVVFDLDPSPASGLAGCARVALEIRSHLARIGLDGLPKTSGFKGLHVYAPVRDVTWDESPDIARGIAESLSDIATTKTAYAQRRGRVLVDWRQNDPRRSLIAAYSLRATPEPSVSTPLTWDEVKRIADAGELPRCGPLEIRERVDAVGDLFAGVVRR
jgi:bifunctional non-homologous end joining protein LigD